MEHDIILFAAWTWLLSSFAQGVIHTITTWVLVHQHNDEEVAIALKEREGTLTLKGFSRGMFDLLLVMVLTWDFDIEDRAWVYTVLVITAIPAYIAMVYGIRFILALRRENWGQPDPIPSRR